MTSQSNMRPMRLLIRNRQAPGDVLVLTAAVRDLHTAHPDAFRIAVDTSFPAIWDKNPHVERPVPTWAPDRVIDAEYPLIHRSNNRPGHFLQGFIHNLEQKLGVSIPIGPFRGDIHLSEEEKRLPCPAVEAGHSGPYWVVVAGGKFDFTAKWWDPAACQSVVDHFKDRIHFVQCGVADDFHPPLANVTNLVGRTTLREFIRLIYHADGVLCPVTFAMHLAAAVPSRPGAPPLRPCVVIAGGREPAHWEAYPGHQFLHTIGALDCCAHGGCWKSRCQPVGDSDPADHNLCTRPITLKDGLQIGKCMSIITPARVIEAISLYYEGGILRYNSPAPAPTPKPQSPSPSPTPARNIAVTIGVGSYAKLAKLAAREVEHRTGLPTVVLGDAEFKASGLEHPAFLKFRLFDVVDADNILFFDADMVALDDWNPSEFFGRPEIACVRERMIPIIRQESQTWNIPPEEHINTGLLVLNREHHAKWLREAESLRFSHPTVLNDQLPLNAARFKRNIPLRRLDRRFNWLGFGASSLSHDVPVVFAHRVAPDRQELNEAYFAGEYSLFAPNLVIDQGSTARLANTTYVYHDATGERRTIRLLADGTIDPIADPAAESYWFVHTRNNRPTIALASETCILHQFVRTMSGTWIATDRTDPDPSSDGPRLIETAHAPGEIVITEENARDLADAFIASAPPYVPDRHHGRGIVVCGGGEKYFPCAWVCIRMLRHVGCTLPIELWHLDAAEMPEQYKRLVEPFNVRTVDASVVQRRHPVRCSMTGWVLKPYAILHSDFQEVMLIDADNVVVRDPAYLFDAPEYRAAGSAFWPDFSRLAPDRAIWRICRVPYRDEPEFETGQLLVDKSRCWLPLKLTLHLNEHHTFYYDYVHGDKELFHMAWRMLNRAYAMTSFSLEPLEGTMCQHDFQGTTVFQHRNMLKWATDKTNRHVAGFHFEDECIRYLNVVAYGYVQA